VNTSRIYLARHGETHWNVEKRIQGQLNSKLTALGINQAHLLAEQTSQLKITKIFSSYLGRAQQTAKVSAQKLDLSIETVSGVEERSFGSWQNKTYQSLIHEPFYQEIFHHVTEHQPPCGESAIAAVSRFNDALVTIIKENPTERCLVISHGDIMRCFLSSLDQSICGDAYSEFDNGCLIAIDYCHVEQDFTRV